MTATVQSLHYYPIKGLAGTALRRAVVGAGGLPFDRRFGLAFADPAALLNETEKWRPWNYFVSLKKHAAAAAIRASAAADGGADDAVVLTLQANGDSISGNPAEDGERRRLEAFLSAALDVPALRLFDSGARPLWDEDGVALSLVNDATVRALAADGGAPAQPARYRANVLFDGAPAWQEEEWRGALAVGEVRLTLAGGVPRCAATTVNPDTAQRDCDPPAALVKRRGHNELGLFAAVAAGGELAVGMEVVHQPAA